MKHNLHDIKSMISFSNKIPKTQYRPRLAKRNEDDIEPSDCIAILTEHTLNEIFLIKNDNKNSLKPKHQYLPNIL